VVDTVLSVQRCMEGQKYGLDRFMKQITLQHETVAHKIDRVSNRMDATTNLNESTDSNESITRHVDSQSERMKTQLERVYRKVEECRSDRGLNELRHLLRETTDALHRKLGDSDEHLPQVLKAVESLRSENDVHFERIYERIRDASRTSEAANGLRELTERKSYIGDRVGDDHRVLQNDAGARYDADTSAISKKVDTVVFQINRISDMLQRLVDRPEESSWTSSAQKHASLHDEIRASRAEIITELQPISQGELAAISRMQSALQSQNDIILDRLNSDHTSTRTVSLHPLHSNIDEIKDAISRVQSTLLSQHDTIINMMESALASTNSVSSHPLKTDVDDIKCLVLHSKTELLEAVSKQSAGSKRESLTQRRSTGGEWKTLQESVEAIKESSLSRSY